MPVGENGPFSCNRVGEPVRRSVSLLKGGSNDDDRDETTCHILRSTVPRRRP